MSEKSIPLRPNATDSPVVHRQGSIRYAPNVKATAEIQGVVRIMKEAAKILDISVTGVSLLVERRYENGALVAVELANPDEGITLLQLIRVVHVKELTPTNFVLGGSFTSKLSGEEVQAFLASINVT